MDNERRNDERKATIEIDDPDSWIRKLRAVVRTEGYKGLLAPIQKIKKDLRNQVLLKIGLNNNERNLLEFLTFIRDQVDDAIRESVEIAGGDAPKPSPKQIMSAIVSVMTPEQAAFFLNRNEVLEPKLILVPVTSVDRWVEILTAQSQNINPPFIHGFATQKLNLQAQANGVVGNTIKGWRFAILEVVQDLVRPDWDSARQTLRQRRKDFRYLLPKGMSCPDLQCYAAAMIQNLHHGKPLDTEAISLLDDTNSPYDEGNDQGITATGTWLESSREVRFYGLSLDDHFTNTRFRPTLMGNIDQSIS